MPKRTTSLPEPVVLGAEQCRELLTEVGWGIFAVVDPDGVPYAVPSAYALARDCVYVASGEGLKRSLLEANPRVCLTVSEVRTFDEWRSVVIRGIAVPVQGIAARTAAFAAFATQKAPRGRPSPAAAARLLEAVIVRLPLDGMTGRRRSPE